MFNRSGAGVYNTNVPVCQETNYQFSLYYKVLQACPTCYIRLTGSNLVGPRSESPTVASYLVVGDWKRIAVNYSRYHKTTAAFYTFIVSDKTPSVNMTVLVDNLELTEIGKRDAASCPQNVPIVNSGFDTGALAPWYIVPQLGRTVPQYSFSTPGYQNSPHALQLSYPQGVPAGIDNPSLFYLWQNTTGDCAQYNYTTSFAVNWGNYTSPSGNPGTEGCYISASPGCYYASGGRAPIYYAADASPGWQVHSFSCELAVNRPGYLKLSVSCEVGDGYKPIPPFTMSIDAFNVSPAPS